MPKATKIQWLTKSPTMQKSISGDKSVQLAGGRLYEIQAMKALKKTYNVDINSSFVKQENAIRYFFKNHTKTINADVCVLDPYVLAFGKFSTSKKNIAIVHHIDESIFQNNALGSVFFKRMISNLKKVDVVVVVAEHWKQYLKDKGVDNIEIIYNSYDLNKFQFGEEKIESLKSSLNFNNDKPIVYLGKLGSGKGVKEVLNSIDSEKYNLVVTGKEALGSDVISTRYFSEDEFPVFLSLCNVVLSMSTMQEGWNRIAHESLLVKTPVIGSGTGGMKELLTKSGQTILTDLNNLDSSIQNCLKNKESYGNLGYEYVSQFDLNYFENSWKDLIEKLI